MSSGAVCLALSAALKQTAIGALDRSEAQWVSLGLSEQVLIASDYG
jgi:hypothetical protein